MNDYVAADVGYYAGVSSDDSKFDYLQIAQRFSTSTSKCKLTEINIAKVKDWLTTKFRIRIYDIDSITGGPGIDLCDHILEVDNGLDVEAYLSRSYNADYVNPDIKIDLKKYNIVIPKKTFYVAVEYLRVVSNASQAPVYNKHTNEMNTSLVFRPFIGISPTTGKVLNIWVMKLNRKWKTYNHFFPFGTDLAIKATIEY